jgi:hypothetical protein
MDMNMVNKLVSILFILLGTHLIINHRKFGRETAESKRLKILPLKKASPKEYSIAYLVGGIIFALVGALVLLGVIHFKG